MNLSDKRLAYETIVSDTIVDGQRVIDSTMCFVYPENDVKEFIRLLKTRIAGDYAEYLLKEIDKLAGDNLNGA